MKRFNLITLLVFGVISITNWGCSAELFDAPCFDGEGSKETREIDLDAITAFDLFGAIDLTIIEGSEQKIEINSFPNLIDLLLDNSFVDNEVWNVGIGGCFDSQDNDIEIIATIAELSGISIDGTGDIKTQGVFENVENLILNINGSGDVDLDLGDNMTDVSVIIGGTGDFSLSGKTENQNINISGSGDMKAFDLETQNTEVVISGTGDCKVNVMNNLDVKITGSGDVCYRGQPNVVTDISGSGKVEDCN